MDFEFYKTQDGGCPVLDFISDLPVKHQILIRKKLNLMRDYGTKAAVSARLLEKMEGTILWEIRLSCPNVIYRILCAKEGDLFWQLHMFQKKTQKTPLKHIEIGEQRAKELGFK